MNVISLTHRILGETLLLVALIGVILAIVGLARKKQTERPEKIFGISYAGLLDFQALLGLIQFVYLLVSGATGLISSFFVLHPIFMLSAVTVIHASRDIPSRLAELQPSLLAEVELLRRKLPRGEARKRRR